MTLSLKELSRDTTLERLLFHRADCVWKCGMLSDTTSEGLTRVEKATVPRL